MLAPRWSFAPLSGEGAALNGGRLNPPGMPALYMSENYSTAIEEYHQGLARPGTLVAYDLSVTGLADALDGSAAAGLRIAMEALTEPWRLIRAEGETPEGWRLAERLIEQGFTGLRFPSQASRDGVNLVLWRWNNCPANRVAARDPDKDLPRDDISWPE